MSHSPELKCDQHITVLTFNGKHCAALMTWNEKEGQFESQRGRYQSKSKAEQDAKEWANERGLEFRK